MMLRTHNFCLFSLLFIAWILAQPFHLAAQCTCKDGSILTTSCVIEKFNPDDQYSCYQYVRSALETSGFYCNGYTSYVDRYCGLPCENHPKISDIVPSGTMLDDLKYVEVCEEANAECLVVQGHAVLILLTPGLYASKAGNTSDLFLQTDPWAVGGGESGSKKMVYIGPVSSLNGTSFKPGEEGIFSVKFKPQLNYQWTLAPNSPFEFVGATNQYWVKVRAKACNGAIVSETVQLNLEVTTNGCSMSNPRGVKITRVCTPPPPSPCSGVYAQSGGSSLPLNTVNFVNPGQVNVTMNGLPGSTYTWTWSNPAPAIWSASGNTMSFSIQSGKSYSVTVACNTPGQETCTRTIAFVAGSGGWGGLTRNDGAEDRNNTSIPFIELKAMPNPFSDEVLLQVPNDLIGSQFRLLDSQGKLVENGIFSQTEEKLVLAKLPAGIYFLVSNTTQIRLLKN